nr:class I adenylate-forming enzyme family protein [Lacticaseibacillus sharpeae]
MTRLTDELHARLAAVQTENVVKDEASNTWFTGSDLSHDINVMDAALRSANIGKDDVVLMCLQNSPVYLPINQAMWYMGATIHPVAPSTGLDGLVADFNENHYAGVIVDTARAAVFTELDAIKEIPLPELRMFDGLVLLQNLQHTTPANYDAPTEDTLGMILNTSGTTGKPKASAKPTR